MQNPNFITAIKCLCPYCGIGKLYHKYYTLNTKCSNCYRSFEEISQIGISSIENEKYDNSPMGFVFNKLGLDKPNQATLFISGFLTGTIALCFFVLPFVYFTINTDSNFQKWQLYVFIFLLSLSILASHIMFLPIIRSFKIHYRGVKKQ